MCREGGGRGCIRIIMIFMVYTTYSGSFEEEEERGSINLNTVENEGRNKQRKKSHFVIVNLVVIFSFW